MLSRRREIVTPLFEYPRAVAVNIAALAFSTVLPLLACGTPATEARKVHTGPTELLHETTAASADLPAPGPTVGAERLDRLLPLLRGKRVGLVVNHTSLSADTHLVDRLLAHDVDVRAVFAPEHGFRGLASDGERVDDQTDPATGLPIVSLYGKQKRPTAEHYADLDVVVFDVQDVGTRFYTYIYTMYYAMDAAAEYGVEVVVLDRPNPLGALVDGPVLDTAYRSFVGLLPLPSVHGMTVGELARMYNGEGWLGDGRNAALTVVPVANYAVGDEYVLPVRPSPNLPNQASIYLYPTLCHFEGTVASIGRGTDFPFQVVGHPRFTPDTFAFTPEARPGARYAKLKGEICYGIDLRDASAATGFAGIDWGLLATVQRALPDDVDLIARDHFDLVAGGAGLRRAVENGELSRFGETYRDEVAAFRERRSPYLLYPRR